MSTAVARPVNAVRRVEGPRYGFVRSAGSGRAWVRGCRAGGGGTVAADADSQITDLAVNDHACLTFGDPEELLDLTAAFVRDGLSGGLKVVWLSEAGPGRAATELARRGIAVEPALASGQMAAAACHGQLLSGQAFSASKAMKWLRGQMAAFRQDGFPGLRVAVDMSWALRPVPGVEQLPEFEEGITAALAGTTVSVLCQYDRERFDPVTLATVPRFILDRWRRRPTMPMRCCGSAASMPRRESGWPGKSTTGMGSRWRWRWRRRSGSTAASR